MKDFNKSKLEKGKVYFIVFIVVIIFIISVFFVLNKKQAIAPISQEKNIEFVKEDINTFTLFISEDNYISLSDWADDEEIERIFGSPEETNVQILGEGSDTFSGSFVKTILYDDLYLTLFSPKDNGITYWLQEISFSNPEYKTREGLYVGAKLEYLKERYPNVEQVKDGREDVNNSAYIISENNRHIIFEIEDGVIINIGMLFEIY